MNDTGLISGLAQGLQSGIQTYASEKDRQLKIQQMQNDIEIKKMVQDQTAQQNKSRGLLDLYKAGAMKDPSGAIIPDPKNPNYESIRSNTVYKTAVGVGVLGDQVRKDIQTDISKRKGQADAVKGGLIETGSGYELSPLEKQTREGKLGLIKAQTTDKLRPKTGKGTGSPGNKDWQKLADALDPNKARGGNLAKSQAMINSADRVDALFQQFPDYNIPSGQTHELSAAVAGLVNGGSAQSQAQINSLTPKSLIGDANGIAAWLTNNPKGLDQKKFMKMMHETAVREREVAQKQVVGAQKSRLSQFDYLYKTDPEKYKRIIGGYGLPTDSFDKFGGIVETPQSGLIKEPDVEAYALKHNLSYESALAVKKKRMGGK